MQQFLIMGVVDGSVMTLTYQQTDPECTYVFIRDYVYTHDHVNTNTNIHIPLPPVQARGDCDVQIGPFLRPER